MSLMSTLFGGSKSSNSAYGFLKDKLSPAVGTGTNAFNTLAQSLGGGFEDFKKNSGFDFQSLLGTRGITGNAAAHGLLNSGATSKALTDYTTNMGQQAYGNWLDRLGGLVQGGQNYAQILAGAGGKSTSNGGLVQGIASLFG